MKFCKVRDAMRQLRQPGTLGIVKVQRTHSHTCESITTQRSPFELCFATSAAVSERSLRRCLTGSGDGASRKTGDCV